jgi:hypothetical protein
VRWAALGEDAQAKKLPQATLLRKTAHENRVSEQMAGDFLQPEEPPEAKFGGIPCEPQDSSIRAAQRRQAFKVISNA